MPDSPLQVMDAALFRALIESARQSPRLRTNHNFHTSMEDNPHRFLNVMVRGTYIAPHRHRDPPKSESFLVLEGKLAFFTFDDAGQITGHRHLGTGCSRRRYPARRVAHDCGLERPRCLLRSKAGPLFGGDRQGLRAVGPKGG